MIKKRQFTKFILILFLPIILKANQVYTVDQLILIALKNSPELKINNLTYNSSKKDKNIAKADYLPKINMNASAYTTGTPFTENKIKNSNIIAGTLSLKQLIYDFGKTSYKNDFANYISKSIKLDQIQKISDKTEEVKEAYYNILKTKALINVQKENIKLNEKQLYRAKQYFKAGIRTIIDVSDAKVDLIRSKIELKNAQYNLKTAYSNLNRILGITSIKRNYEVCKNKIDLKNINMNLLKYNLTLEQAIKFAYKNRPEVQKYKIDIKSTKTLVKMNNSKYYPELHFDADYTKQTKNELQPLTPKDQYKAGINLTWNIYQGGITKNQIEKSKIDAEISTLKLSDILLHIKQETTSRFLNIKKQKDTLLLSKNLLSVSLEKFNQASKRYKHGLSDFIELQQAKQGYIDAKASLIIDYYNYYIAVAKLNNIIGK